MGCRGSPARGQNLPPEKGKGLIQRKPDSINLPIKINTFQAFLPMGHPCSSG